MNVRVGTKGRYIMAYRIAPGDYPRRYEAPEHTLRCGLIRRLDRVPSKYPIEPREGR